MKLILLSIHILLYIYLVLSRSDGDGATALIYASMKGHTEIVDLLVRKNADLNVQDKVTEWTALMQATCNG